MLAHGELETTGGRKIAAGDFVCDGESVPVSQPSAIVVRVDGNGPPQLEVRVLETRGAFVELGGVYAARVVVRTSKGGEVASRGGAIIDVAGSDLSVQGVSATEVGQAVQSLTVEGFQRAPQGLTVAGDLNGSRGVLFVVGKLEVGGSVTGAGAVFVTGDATLRGKVSLEPVETIALAVGGTLTLGRK